jgi:hypothetical protein
VRTLAPSLRRGGLSSPELGDLLASSHGSDALKYLWLPDAIDLRRAREALGFAYIPIEGAAGNVDISVGYFRAARGGFEFVAPIHDLFGQSPPRRAIPGESS